MTGVLIRERCREAAVDGCKQKRCPKNRVKNDYQEICFQLDWERKIGTNIQPLSELINAEFH